MSTGNEIRSSFLKFFEERGHTVVSSSGLVPESDPTLLFANAGMNQFKDTFLGRYPRPYTRAATCQKVVRAGGKHNDLENVGRTSRHHTFFEMLGNFSFGDYFKKDAISFAWEYLAEVLKLPKEKLFVSVYKDDDEAAELWHKLIGLPNSRIHRRGEKDNFWQMGDTGPCGPCSEIHIDQGPSTGCGRPECNPDCDCDRHLELWNLVFMQYNRDAEGKLHPLPKPSIDTGMGLERVASVVQQVTSNYDTDLILPLIDYIAMMAGLRYGEDKATDVSLRVIADHARAAAFLISDGVLPSNEGRGYVLRRIMRRAMRHGNIAGMESTFFYKVASFVIDLMKGHYADLGDKNAYVERIVLAEEEAFGRTLTHGLKLINEEILDKIPKGSEVEGKLLFKLYDTYGFPLDLLRDVLTDAEYKLDEEGFDREMALQQENAKRGGLGLAAAKLSDEIISLGAKHSTNFTGYDTLTGESRVAAVSDGSIILHSTPFYAEGGGQISDKGTVEGDGWKLEVERAFRSGGAFVHTGKLYGYPKAGDLAKTAVSKPFRDAVRKNHTATHLLHKALREVLGEHVRQAGSSVTNTGLRFDFTHFNPVTEEELAKITAIVNEKIDEALPVTTAVKSYSEARGEGATALFGEKYGDTVRVVEAEGFSKELCGGTHVDNTARIGAFAIISEQSAALGVRRIEALTGITAVRYLTEGADVAAKLSLLFKTPVSELQVKAGGLLSEIKELERKVNQAKGSVFLSEAERQIREARVINGVKACAVVIEGLRRGELRSVCDLTLEKIVSGVALAATVSEGKVEFVCKVSKELTGRFKAGDLVKRIAKEVDGTGGGMPHMAQGGGKNPDGLERAVKAFYESVGE